MSEPIIDPDFPPEDPVPPEPDPVEPGPETPVVDGWTDAPVSGDRVNVFDAPIVAGDPDGARVEIASDGLHAYDATGTETATIRGEEGVFVGGEFRTSDTLPGQITLSDTANQGTPGLSVEPEDSTGYDVLPSIGPGPDDMHISGGVSTDGTMSGAQFGAAGTSIYHNGPGANGTGTWMLANGGEVRLAIRPDRTNQSNESGVWVRPFGSTLFTEDATGMGHVSATPTSVSVAQVGVGDPIARSESGIYASPDRIMIERKAPGSVGRHRLLVDDDGVWVQNVFGDTDKSTNLLGTTWTNLTLLNGWQAYTGAGGYFNGLRAQRTPLGIRVDGMIQSGTTGVIAVLPDSMQDVAAKQFTAVASVSGRDSAYLAVARSTAHGDKYAVHYLQGPSAPNYVSVSTDAALL